MDTITAVKAIVAIIFALLLHRLAFSSPSEADKPKQKQKPESATKSATEAPRSKKKKNKKKKSSGDDSKPKPVPPPSAPVVKPKAPLVEPEPVPVPVLVPVVVEASTNGKKKKKKKSKAAAAAAATAAAAAAPKKVEKPVVKVVEAEKPKQVVTEQVAEEPDSDDDDDDDALLTFAKGGRPESKKKNAKKTATDASNNGGGWNTITSKNGSAKAAASVATKEDGNNGPATITLNLTSDDVPTLIGPKGATIQRIQSTTGARLDVDKSFNTQRVKISGSEQQIAVAMEEIQSLLSSEALKKSQATAHTVTLSGATIKGSDGIKAIIGRGGATIQAIEATTGCQLNANIDDGSVVISGSTAEAVAAATTMCQNAVFGESNHTIDLGSRSMVFCVCGRNFAGLQQVQNESGARLDVEKGATLMAISGDTANVESAKRMVMQKMAQCQGVTMEMESSKIGALFGKGGTNLRRIQDDTGAFVEVAQSGEKADVKIVGEPDAVHAAKALVLKSLSGEVELKPGEIQATVELGVGTAAVIGRGGSKIAELEQTHGVKINVQGGSSGCSIVGKKAAVEGAKAEIESIVAPLIEKAMQEAKIIQQAEQLTVNGDDTWGTVSANGVGWDSQPEETGW